MTNTATRYGVFMQPKPETTTPPDQPATPVHSTEFNLLRLYGFALDGCKTADARNSVTESFQQIEKALGIG